MSKLASRELLAANEASSLMSIENLQHSFNQMQGFVKEMNLKVV